MHRKAFMFDFISDVVETRKARQEAEKLRKQEEDAAQVAAIVLVGAAAVTAVTAAIGYVFGKK